MQKRILGLDLGEKWIGVAHTDSGQSIVFSYGTWLFVNFHREFGVYLKKHIIEAVVIGLPLTLQGNHSEQTRKVISWVDGMRLQYPLFDFYLQDERFSSQFAARMIQREKIKKITDHALSASIILENFLQQYKKL